MGGGGGGGDGVETCRRLVAAFRSLFSEVSCPLDWHRGNRQKRLS